MYVILAEKRFFDKLLFPTTATKITVQLVMRKKERNLLMTTPFYNPHLSYEDNYTNGPFGAFTESPQERMETTNPLIFLNLPIKFPFGIPAGPLLNADYIKSALNFGFDLVTYKTVRTRAQKSQPLPNVLAVHPQSNQLKTNDIVLADNKYDQPLSITNSFGVPSFDPDVWQPDLAEAVQAANKGQAVIGSFQGTSNNEMLIEKDYAIAAKLVAETNAPILEANLSCPNEGKNKLLCFDIDKVEKIAQAIKNSVPDRPLLLKLAFFSQDDELIDLIKRLNGVVDGYTAINTISARPVDHTGAPALDQNRPTSGVCGDSIRWAGLDMVQRLSSIRSEHGLNFVIVGVGGVSSIEHFNEYQKVGADAVLSATGAMWNPNLAFDLKRSV